MSASLYCVCKGGPTVLVIPRKSRCSAFDGYRVMPSRYSTVMCLGCERVGRTRARYVDSSPDAPPNWQAMTVEQLRQYRQGESCTTNARIVERS